MYCVCAKSLQLCPTVCDPIDCSPPSSSVHRDIPGKNTGVGCHALLQGIFPTQGLNPHLLVLPALAGGFFPSEVPGKCLHCIAAKSLQSCPTLVSDSCVTP